MRYDRRDIATARRMAEAYAGLEATRSADRFKDDPLAVAMADWARERRLRLERRIGEALDRDPLTLTLFGELP